MSMEILTVSTPISTTSYSWLNNLYPMMLLKRSVTFRRKTSSSSKRLYLVKASKLPTEEANSPTDKLAILSQEDLIYLVKLGAGSVAGAAAIKYGSIIFSDITRPSIVQALVMIFAPVVVAVVLLIKQSRAD